MSADAVLVVADTLRTHRDLGWRDHDDPRFPSRCPHPCAQQFKTDEAHAAHVAAAVVDALGGLERQWLARHTSGGGRSGCKSLAEARQHIAEHPPRPGGVESPPDPGYVGVDVRWVSGWVREPAEEGL